MIKIKPEQLDWEKMQGLIPVIAQEYNTKEVLTLAYINLEALTKTIETGFAHYYRRSHKEVMMKGITSGNTQKIIEILSDCDNDSIIYLVEQKGPACHLGERTCFHKIIE
ncbi:phosphoribosyl-AMP cyclohydrolase [Candidatus Bathyarchaeota archaeon]|nr:phosphoribosyl-AMP cyclohydrolase [Candidatus Bathyarchaeota archaeon]